MTCHIAWVEDRSHGMAHLLKEGRKLCSLRDRVPDVGFRVFAML